MKHSGSLTVYTGPMFCGKTTRLITDITGYADMYDHVKPLLINSQLDVRNIDEVISSHSSNYKGLSPKVVLTSTGLLNSIDVTNYDVIGVDEAQFFPDLVKSVKSWVSQGKHVICAGLDSDIHMNPFGHLHELLHFADDFVKLKAVCGKCISENKGFLTLTKGASFTGKYSKLCDGNVVEIGGADKYYASCRRHM
jgi:thymidine kinase